MSTIEPDPTPCAFPGCTEEGAPGNVSCFCGTNARHDPCEHSDILLCPQHAVNIYEALLPHKEHPMAKFRANRIIDNYLGQEIEHNALLATYVEPQQLPDDHVAMWIWSVNPTTLKKHLHCFYLPRGKQFGPGGEIQLVDPDDLS